MEQDRNQAMAPGAEYMSLEPNKNYLDMDGYFGKNPDYG